MNKEKSVSFSRKLPRLQAEGAMADLQDDPGFQYRLLEGQKLLDRAKQVIPPTNPPQASPTEPQPIAASPEKGTNALATNPPSKEAPPVRRVSNAPKPATDLSGPGSWMPPPPKPTQMPSGFPFNYPIGLKLQTDVIRGEARKKFPVQTHTLQ